jgi:hypothetical protein
VGKRVKLTLRLILIELKTPGDILVDVKDLIQIRKLYDLAFAITMKSRVADLGAVAQGRRRVFMVDDQVM